jgi:putative drug exporter of the RND superfamily
MNTGPAHLAGPAASDSHGAFVSTVFARLGGLAVRFRWVVLVVWVVGFVASQAFLPSLFNVTQSDNTTFLPPSAPSQQAIQLATSLQKANLTGVTVIAARPASPLTAADQSAVQRLDQALAKVPDVVSVRDAGQSPDRHAVQVKIFAQLTTSAGGRAAQAQTTLVNGMRSAISGVSLPSGLQVHLAGPAAVRVDNNTQSKRNGSNVQLLSIIFVIVLLGLVFRSMLAPIIAVLPALLVVLTAEKLSAEAALHGLQVSTFASLMLIVLVIGAGTDYALFLMFRVREEIRGGTEPREAVAKAVARVGESITFSAATVIAALLSLLTATFGLMLLAGLTLVPALLAIFGEAAFWPARLTKGAPTTGWWGRNSARIVRRPGITLAAGVIVFGALAAASASYAAGGFGGAVTAPAGSDSAAGAALLSRYFPQTAANPTALVFRLPQAAWNNPQALATLQTELKADSQFGKLSGPLNATGAALTPAQYAQLHATLGPPSSLPASAPGSAGGGQGQGKGQGSGRGTTAKPPVPGTRYEAYRASALFVSTDGRTVEFATSLRAGDPSTTAAAHAIPAVRADVARAARAAGATGSGVAGLAAATYDVGNISNSDLTRVIPIAIAVIAILLALVMRSLVAPLYLIASVALSYFAALGLTVLVFMKLGGQPGLTFILPFLMFVFLLALGEDYNILVMARIREEAAHLPLRQAVAKALSITGTTVTSAGIVLAGTFGILALVGGRGGSTNTALDIGTGLALGVAMDTFLVRTLLVPATVVLLGRWNWWPSKLGTKETETAGPAAPASPAPPSATSHVNRFG